MIKSQYIADILELITDEDANSINLKEQIKCLTEKEVEYTETGAFVYFNQDNNITDSKLDDDFVLTGVKVENKEFGISADATLFITAGIIDYLEIFCIDGLYPKIDPIHYKLVQEWSTSERKEIER
jgi:hypothetical protein